MAESGIYEIVNLVNGKRYVGSACKLKQRKIDHWKQLRGGRHHSRHLQASWNKHGENSFKFRLIEAVDDKGRLIEREQHYFDVLKPEYNIAKIAGSCLGVRHTAESKAKMSRARKGRRLSPEQIEHLRKINTGRKASPESIARMKKAQRARVENNPEYRAALLARQVKLSTDPEIRRKRSEALKGRTSPMKGKRRSAETIEKTAAAHRGRKRSPETRARISAALAGKKRGPRSAEYRANLSRALKGKKKSAEHMAALQEGRRNRGVSEAEREKHRANTAARWARGDFDKRATAEYRAKISASLRGRKATAAHRAKLSAAQQGKKRGPYKTKPDQLALPLTG